MEQFRSDWSKVYCLGIMAKTKKNMDWYISCKVVHNQIGTKGMKYLSQTNWPHLEEINIGLDNIILGLNNIEDTGCDYLAKADWKHLRKLFLGNN